MDFPGADFLWSFTLQKEASWHFGGPDWFSDPEWIFFGYGSKHFFRPVSYQLPFMSHRFHFAFFHLYLPQPLTGVASLFATDIIGTMYNPSRWHRFDTSRIVWEIHHHNFETWGHLNKNLGHPSNNKHSGDEYPPNSQLVQVKKYSCKVSWSLQVCNTFPQPLKRSRLFPSLQAEASVAGLRHEAPTTGTLAQWPRGCPLNRCLWTFLWFQPCWRMWGCTNHSYFRGVPAGMVGGWLPVRICWYPCPSRIKDKLFMF